MSDPEITAAVAAIRRGDLVVYPTETVYGLGANALDPEAIGRVFETKGRSHEKPLSMAVPELAAAADYTEMTALERQFCARFLPGPVTVLVERTDRVPDELVAGRERVGIRIPDCDIARDLARRTGPITATSANRSGTPSARRIEDIDPNIREQAVVIDGGETPGTESTVVNVSESRIVRRGARADEIEAWLADRSE